MTYDPKILGADCDNCPLGPNGYLRKFTKTRYHPVGPQVSPDENYKIEDRIAAVAECPADHEIQNGYPLAGPSGVKWNEILRVVDVKRNQIDLFNTVSCMPPGVASGAYERMTVLIDRENKLRLGSDLKPLIHPNVCCKPRLVNELKGYRKLIALGKTAAQSLTNRHKSITAQRGDGWESASGIKVMPTFHPAFVIRSPVYMQTVVADIGKALRWFKDELSWKDPIYLRQPTCQQLEDWLKASIKYFRNQDKRIRLIMDTETFIADPINTRMLCFAIGYAGPEGCHVVAVNVMSKKDDSRFYVSDEEDRIRELIRDYVLDNPNVDLVGHNLIGYDKRVIERYFYGGDIQYEP